jgi:hypothetical protein
MIEIYLNIGMGPGVYGAEAASRFISENSPLSKREAALAAICKSH